MHAIAFACASAAELCPFGVLRVAAEVDPNDGFVAGHPGVVARASGRTSRLEPAVRAAPRQGVCVYIYVGGRGSRFKERPAAAAGARSTSDLEAASAHPFGRHGLGSQAGEDLRPRISVALPEAPATVVDLHLGHRAVGIKSGGRPRIERQCVLCDLLQRLGVGSRSMEFLDAVSEDL
jgi:hypothetical protein